jgi:malate synthase
LSVGQPRTERAFLVARPLHAFVERKALPGTGISIAAFWSGLADLAHDFGERNRQLLDVRDGLPGAHRRLSRRPYRPAAEGAKKCAADKEAAMTEADQFRQYAEEATHGSSKATSENERQTLIDLACTWAQASLMSDRVFGSNFISSPRDVGEATPLTRP